MFDLEKAKEADEKYRSKDENVNSLYWAFVSADMLSTALDEIERLQDREQQLMLDVNRNHKEAMTYKAAYDKQAARIKELEDSLARKNSADLVIEDQRKRIERLEAAFLEARAEAESADRARNPLESDYQVARAALEELRRNGTI